VSNRSGSSLSNSKGFRRTFGEFPSAHAETPACYVNIRNNSKSNLADREVTSATQNDMHITARSGSIMLCTRIAISAQASGQAPLENGSCAEGAAMVHRDLQILGIWQDP
jgi:hypothetical protein